MTEGWGHWGKRGATDTVWGFHWRQKEDTGTVEGTSGVGSRHSLGVVLKERTGVSPPPLDCDPDLGRLLLRGSRGDRGRLPRPRLHKLPLDPYPRRFPDVSEGCVLGSGDVAMSLLGCHGDGRL